MKNAWLIERWRDIRQLCFAPAFRIDAMQAPENDSLKNLLAELQTSLEQQPGTSHPAATAGGPVTHDKGPDDSALDDDKFVAGLLTRIWRVRSKMLDARTGSPISGSEQSHRHIERMISEFVERGLRIEDKQGLGYDAGMAVDVIASEPVPGIERPVINETIQPAIYKNDALIQIAQVIVGVPDDLQSDSPEDRQVKKPPGSDTEHADEKA